VFKPTLDIINAIEENHRHHNFDDTLAERRLDHHEKLLLEGFSHTRKDDDVLMENSIPQSKKESTKSGAESDK